jgi:hypothetical protein
MLKQLPDERTLTTLGATAAATGAVKRSSSVLSSGVEFVHRKARQAANFNFQASAVANGGAFLFWGFIRVAA